MRYCKMMPRLIASCVVMCAWVCGCATTSPRDQTTALERAVADDDDLGDPRASRPEEQAANRARQEAQARAALDDPGTTHVDFDGEEENGAPVDRVSIPPDRSPSPSMMNQIRLGPSS